MEGSGEGMGLGWMEVVAILQCEYEYMMGEGRRGVQPPIPIRVLGPPIPIRFEGPPIPTGC